MWNALEWGRRQGNQGAVRNARAAATLLCRLRAERDEVELYITELTARRARERKPA